MVAAVEDTDVAMEEATDTVEAMAMVADMVAMVTAWALDHMVTVMAEV